MTKITATAPPKIETPKPAAPPPPKPAPKPEATKPDAFIGKVEGSPEFKKLDKATQGAVDTALKGASTPEARKHIAELACSPGFGKLSTKSQDAALKALLKDPGNADYAGSIKQAVNNGGPYTELKSGSSGPAVNAMQQKLKDAGFDPGKIDGQFGPKTKAALEGYQKAQGLKVDGIAGPESLGELNGKRFSGLSEARQVQVLEQMSKHPTDPAARETIANTATAPGFRALDDAKQEKLLNLIGGTNVDLARDARNEMTTLLSDPKFEKASAADQKAQLEKFLTDQPGLRDVVQPEAGAFDGKREKYKLTGPTDVKNHAFKGGKADALKYEVEIDGKKIPVWMPKNPDASMKYHSIEEVAKGLAALPASSRALVKEVSVEQKVNPDDAFWAKEYKDPNFHSYMTAGEAGVVSIYPGSTKQSQDYLDGTLIHETGHTLSKQKWGNDDDPKWKDWKDAMGKDGISSSQYAKKSQGEDFAETLQLYQQVKGTPQEAEVRALMPERFKIIDELLSGKR